MGWWTHLTTFNIFHVKLVTVMFELVVKVKIIQSVSSTCWLGDNYFLFIHLWDLSTTKNAIHIILKDINFVRNVIFLRWKNRTTHDTKGYLQTCLTLSKCQSLCSQFWTIRVPRMTVFPWGILLVGDLPDWSQIWSPTSLGSHCGSLWYQYALNTSLFSCFLRLHTYLGKSSWISIWVKMHRILHLSAFNCRT